MSNYELPRQTVSHQVNENIRLLQDPKGLTFGTDAYLLAAYIRPRASARAVDLGSGTGIIPLLSLARQKADCFTAVEIQPSFCSLIEKNAEENADTIGGRERLHALCADVRELTPACIGGEVDLVTANPPYMAADSGARNEADEKYLARHEVCGTIYDFCDAAGRLLKHGGRFCCVFRPNRLGDLFDALRRAHLEPKRMTLVQATAHATPSMVLVEAVKYAAPSLLVTPPLCLWEPAPTSPEKPRQPMTPTAESEYVYGHCAFPPQFTGTNQSR